VRPISQDIEAFLALWAGSEQAERTNAPPFLIGLCDLLGLPHPAPASGGRGDYRFERSVTHHHDDDRKTTKRIDLYRRDCFILEAKQGANAAPPPDLFGLTAEATSKEATRRQTVRNSPGWQRHMMFARGQAERYVMDLPAEEAAPPFLIVCDIGFCFDIYADFSGTGRHYVHFPDREGFRIYLTDLRRPEIRARLAGIWQDPQSLNPARRRTEVTREIAEFLAILARGLEARHSPNEVAFFLMRCLFCMFAQSVNLLPEPTAFTDLLERCRGAPEKFVGLVGELWRQMNTGGFSVALGSVVKRFNGGLYAAGAGTAEPLPATADEIALLITAARRDWANVDPAIFGTLLENALTTRQRGQLGAHFTPRAFVERLVLPTVMEPLREEWDGFRAASYRQLELGNPDAAAKLLREFHARLCAVRVLDPACGTGNFLYVTMELMKRLEGEVLDALANIVHGEGDRLALAGASVDPHQFLGLEKNPRAVPVAELVLWIGYLQWHFRTVGSAPPEEPILRDFHNIRHTDALMTDDGEELLRDKAGLPVTKWDGIGFRLHPVTGEQVPNDNARREVTKLRHPRLAIWPEADFIIGNPPFIAGKDMRAELGDGYATALWKLYGKVPQSADLALFFWWKAAQALTANKVRTRRFGFITSNSIRQIFCRRVVADAMSAKRPLRLAFAIPDHPWSDGVGAAAVRIAMTVATRLKPREVADGVLHVVATEIANSDGVPGVTLSMEKGVINPDLSIGADPDRALELRANGGIGSPGVKLHGAGFIITPVQAAGLGLGKIAGLDRHIRPYLNGRDLTQRSRGMMVIDMFGLSEAELRNQYPATYQNLLLRVKPDRDQNARRTYRDNWWIFGEARSDLRRAAKGLPRYIVTVETAKHRPFCFLSAAVIPDNKLICIASDDAFHLGVLSSRFHVAWSLAAGGRLGVGNDPVYVKTRCFDPFPFPNANPRQRATIAAIAEELDALRRTRLDAHPHLTMTGLYNALDRLRSGAVLTPADRDTHDAGQVSILLTLHDTLDAAVATAYGWKPDLTASEVVAHVVTLNLARQAEEQQGLVRWLRPEFQAPTARRSTQATLQVDQGEAASRPRWPAKDPERFVALRSLLAIAPGHVADLTRHFENARTDRVGTMLETLVALGQAKHGRNGLYHA
jgi:hypothetical protein